MDYCDFLSKQRRRVQFLSSGDAVTAQMPQLLYAGIHRPRPGERGARFKDHWTVHLILAGSADARIGKRDYQLQAGDIFLYQPLEEKILHAANDRTASTESNCNCVWAWTGFHAPSLRAELQECGYDGNQVIHDCGRQFRQDLLRLYDYLYDNSSVTIRQRQALLQLLLMQIMERLQKQRKPARQSDAQQHPAVTQALQLMQRSSGEQLGVADVAAAVGLERSYFSRLFKQQCGSSVQDTLARIRLRRAESLLRESDLPIYGIAELCGFEAYYSFHRFFKQATGLSPTQFRQQQQ